MNKIYIFLVAVLIPMLGACGDSSTEMKGLSPETNKQWSDPNYMIIGVGAYNYTDYDIYNVYVLPKGGNDIRYAALGTGQRAAPKDAMRWDVEGPFGANLVWDLRWSTPRKFKVWWFRVVDASVYSASAGKYDKYASRETHPGAAWCEGEITVTHPPTKSNGGDLIIHFFPDGHIEGDVAEISGNDASRMNIGERGRYLGVQDRACIKEIANPYFGKKKPAAAY
jgi:hypothetical protein